MLDRTIPFYNTILRCDHYLAKDTALPEGYSVVTYKPGYEKAWAELEYSVGDFDSAGEAEEYFEDLGLEYNKDYVDRGTTNEEDDDALEEVKKEKKPKKAPEPIKEDNDLDDDNLFDLIDSMYDE